MLKTLTIATLLVFTLGCDPGDDNTNEETNALALGGKADQACDPNASDAHGSEDATTVDAGELIADEDATEDAVAAADAEALEGDETVSEDTLAEEGNGEEELLEETNVPFPYLVPFDDPDAGENIWTFDHI